MLWTVPSSRLAGFNSEYGDVRLHSVSGGKIQVVLAIDRITLLPARIVAFSVPSCSSTVSGSLECRHSDSGILAFSNAGLPASSDYGETRPSVIPGCRNAIGASDLHAGAICHAR